MTSQGDSGLVDSPLKDDPNLFIKSVDDIDGLKPYLDAFKSEETIMCTVIGAFLGAFIGNHFPLQLSPSLLNDLIRPGALRMAIQTIVAYLHDVGLTHILVDNIITFIFGIFLVFYFLYIRTMAYTLISLGTDYDAFLRRIIYSALYALKAALAVLLILQAYIVFKDGAVLSAVMLGLAIIYVVRANRYRTLHQDAMRKRKMRTLYAKYK